jgi:hypothetical protein
MTIGVQEKIGRLHISMEKICRVKEFESFQELPDNIFLVDILQNSCTDDSMQVLGREGGGRGM